VAEYLAIESVAQEAIKIASFLRALGYNGTDLAPIQIYTDSANVQALTKGGRPVLKERHADIKLCKIKDDIEQGRIELHHIPGVDQPADGLTKALPKAAHEAFKTGVGVTKVSWVT
jgi:hypothetical protein